MRECLHNGKRAVIGHPQFKTSAEVGPDLARPEEVVVRLAADINMFKLHVCLMQSHSKSLPFAELVSIYM